MSTNVYHLIKNRLGIEDTIAGEWMDFSVFLILALITVYCLFKIRAKQKQMNIDTESGAFGVLKRATVIIFLLVFLSICGMAIQGIQIVRFTGYEVLSPSGIPVFDLMMDLILLLVTITVLVYSTWYLIDCRKNEREVPRQNKRFAVYGILVSAFCTAAGIAAVMRYFTIY